MGNIYESDLFVGLEEDYDTPFSIPDDTTPALNSPDHPRYDSNIDAQELYDQGY